jgi:hypothetical protein
MTRNVATTSRGPIHTLHVIEGLVAQCAEHIALASAAHITQTERQQQRLAALRDLDRIHSHVIEHHAAHIAAVAHAAESRQRAATWDCWIKGLAIGLLGLVLGWQLL